MAASGRRRSSCATAGVWSQLRPHRKQRLCMYCPVQGPQQQTQPGPRLPMCALATQRPLTEAPMCCAHAPLVCASLLKYGYFSAPGFQPPLCSQPSGLSMWPVCSFVPDYMWPVCWQSACCFMSIMLATMSIPCFDSRCGCQFTGRMSLVPRTPFDTDTDTDTNIRAPGVPSVAELGVQHRP